MSVIDRKSVVAKKFLIFLLIKKTQVTTAVKSNQSKLHIYLCFLGMAPASLDMQLVCSALESKPQAMLMHIGTPTYSRLLCMIWLEDATAELDLLTTTRLGKR